MDNKKYEKSTEKFNCMFCDYTTRRQSHYQRHLLTSKHKKIINDTDNDNEKVLNDKCFNCCICDKKYTYTSG